MGKIKYFFEKNKIPFYAGLVLILLSTAMLAITILKRFDEKEKAIRGEKIHLPKNELPFPLSFENSLETQDMEEKTGEGHSSGHNM